MKIISIFFDVIQLNNIIKTQQKKIKMYLYIRNG